MVREPLKRACHHFAALTWCRLRPEGQGMEDEGEEVVVVAEEE